MRSESTSMTSGENISTLRAHSPLDQRKRGEEAVHANLAGKIAQAWRRFPIAAFVLYVTVNAFITIATVGNAEAQDRTARPSEQRDGRRLSIEWGVTDVQYRRQLLTLTPLGSSYEDVRAFVLHEWMAEKLSLKSNPRFPAAMTQRAEQIVPSADFTGFGVSLFLRDEPPHIKIVDLNNPFAAQEGRRYIQPLFYYKPIWWKRSLYVTVLYVFDARSRVIDLFAHGGVVMPSP